MLLIAAMRKVVGPVALEAGEDRLAVRITSSSSSSSGTKPLPPHVGHCRSSSVPFSMTPSPLQSGQVFTCVSLWTPPQALIRQPNVMHRAALVVAVIVFAALLAL